jgi:hypothetical protein
MTKSSKACTWCAGRKKACEATEAWLAMVATLHPIGEHTGENICLLYKSNASHPPKLDHTPASKIGTSKGTLFI